MPAARDSSAPLPIEVSLARIISQGLIPATAAPDVVQAVSRQLAIQGQQVSAVPHALIVRTPTGTGGDVADAFERGDLVRSWPMRGTVHITAASDHHWLRAALRHRMDAWTRRSESEFGVDGALCERAAEAALAVIGRRRCRAPSCWRSGARPASWAPSRVRTSRPTGAVTFWSASRPRGFWSRGRGPVTSIW